MTLQVGRMIGSYPTHYSIQERFESCNWFVEIKLDSNFVPTPLTQIKGQLLIRSISTVIPIQDIRVQLDATLNLKLKTSKGPRQTEVKKVEGILKLSSTYGSSGKYIISPVSETISIRPDIHKYPFTLTFPEEALPSPFRTQYASLKYQIAAYQTQNLNKIAEKTIIFEGYNNLSQHPNISRPLRHEVSGILAVLAIPRGGFLTGSEVPFTFTVENTSQSKVNKFSIALVRRVTYFATMWATKTVSETVDRFEKKEARKDTVVTYEGSLAVPYEMCGPTYNGKQAYSLAYFVEYELKVAGKHVSGQAEVIIGTADEPLDVLISRRLNSLQLNYGGQCMPSGRQRSDSISSSLSDSSVMTTAPPLYSQLFSRAESLFSLETLPPHYDDLN